MKRWLPAFLLVLFVPMVFSAEARAESRTLRGTVVYRERIALPPSARADVKLIDVSKADAPEIVIAETRIVPAGQVPIPYKLRFESTRIKAGHRYALQARITVDDKLWFITMDHHAVFTGAPDKTEILVRRVMTKPDSATLAGRWLAEDINGGGVIDRLQTVLEIAKDGTVSGTGGCNRMTGKATIDGAKISFGPIASTRMACTPAAMDQESKFFAALHQIVGWRIDPATDKLLLLDAADMAIVTFSRL